MSAAPGHDRGGVEKILEVLDGVELRGGKTMTLCPAHDDHNPSLSVTKKDDGQVLLKCFAGCDQDEVLAALEQRGIKRSDLFPPRGALIPPNGRSKGATRPRKGLGELMRSYEVRDASGRLQGIHERYEDGENKTFLWKQPNGEYSRNGAIKSEAMPLYGSELVKNWSPDHSIVVVEGEKAQVGLRAIGIRALGTVTGAKGTPSLEALEVLRNRRVILWPDADEKGEKHMRRVGQALQGIAASVRWFEPIADASPKDDAADHPAVKSGDKEEVRVLARRLSESPELPPEEIPSNDHAPSPRSRNTDMGNSERFVAQYGESVRYCYPWGKWLVWTGSRWALDDSGMVHRLAKETVKGLYVEAGKAETEEDRKALASHARRSESATSIKAMLELARSDVPVSPEDLDAHPYLLNAPNGTVDLRTGEIREHHREDLLTKITGADYRPDTPAPAWEAFLERVLPSTDLREFVQRSAGYSATGDTSEQCIFINHGGGANGKSTFQEAMAGALGDYATRTPTDMLMARRFNGVPNDVARLKGARFVAAAETDEGRRLDEARIKDLTGQDTITARFMHAEWFDFSPTHKLHLSTNHKPEIRGTDNAIWRRIRLIPWSVTVPAAEQDKKLPEKLRRELTGILAWMVDGCLQWRREGLKTPEEVRKATGAYRAEMDVLAAFLREECATVDGESTSATVLFKRYSAWCEETGENAGTQRKFGERLKERGYEKQRITSGPDKGKYEYLRIVLLRGSGDTGGSGPSVRKHGIGEQSKGSATAPEGSNRLETGPATVHPEALSEQSFTAPFTDENTSKSHENHGDTPRSSEPSEPKNDLRAMEKRSHGITQKQGSLHSLRSPQGQEEDSEVDIEGLANLYDLDRSEEVEE